MLITFILQKNNRMKKIIGLLLIAFSIASCTTDIEPIDPGLNPNNGGNGNLNALFTADIDGVFNDFTSTVQAVLTEDGVTVGTNGDPTLAVQVFNPAVGTFNVDANNTNTGAIIAYSSGVNSLYVPASGTVTITSFDTVNETVSGTFTGVMSDIAGVDPDVIITNGVFQNIMYIVTTSTDECEADIDGTVFVADFFASIEINNQIGITFSNSLNEQINLSFPLGVTAGTYPIEGLAGTYTGTYEDTTGTVYHSVAGSGDLIITSVANNVYEGTFNFTAEESGNPGNVVVVSNGNFVYDNN